MYLRIARFFCTLLAIFASQFALGFAADLPNGNNQESVPKPTPQDFSQSALALPDNPPTEFHPPALSEIASLWQSETTGGFEIHEVCVDPNGVLDDGLNDSLRAADRHKQHSAPELVLRFSSGCTDAEFVNWKLSSRDKPRAQPAIPHGPLLAELLVDKPIDFVELMFDGKPLKPTNYASESPLSYSLPCPAPGQHWLQARFLSGNIWSLYSNPIRFEVRLPAQPRIIAASDFDRDPTPIVRNSTTSITSHSIKVHLADVNRGDNIVAYIDDKRLPPRSHALKEYHGASVASNSELCCRVFKVEGAVIPGVHKLTVRVVGCGGECSITSLPSNPISFHYYDEDIYLLKPGAGCSNGRPGQVCAPHLDSTSGNIQTLQSTPLVFFPRNSGVINVPQVKLPITQSVTNSSMIMDTVQGGTTIRFISYLQIASSKEANDAYRATKQILADTVFDEAAELKLIEESVNESKKAATDAESHWVRAQGHLKNALLENNRVQELARLANKLSVQANTYAADEAARGDTARSRVARQRSDQVALQASLANDQVVLAEQNYAHARAFVADAEAALKRANTDSAATETLYATSRQQVKTLVAARADVIMAEAAAKEAYNVEASSQKQSDESGAHEALLALIAAQGIAEQRSKEFFVHADQIKQFATWAAERKRDASDSLQRASEAADRVHSFTAAISQSANRAMQLSTEAARIARLAGRVMDMDAATERTWDDAEEQAAYYAAVARHNAANAGNDESGVRRVQESAKAAKTLASHEWNKADLRIAEGEANALRYRSEKIVGPSSPFYFAAAAHFPLREFGLRGEPLDRDGIIIYEDMAFHFDRHGNYEVHFRADAPNMPATMRLQFQIQTHSSGPWYTVTLAPIDFPYPSVKSNRTNCSGSNCGDDHSHCSDESKNCCGDARECVCKGHSEILRRCYGEMGLDARIRRSGTARFGFGVNVPNQL